MCSIYGAFGEQINETLLARIAELAGDRGRDGGRHEWYTWEQAGYVGALGNWRATPTTESEVGKRQPYEGIVHNGTIANDAELGNPEGRIDSMVLPSVLDRRSLASMQASIRRIKGSYAIAAAAEHPTIYLATNYKPIYVLKVGSTKYFSSMERHLLPLCEFGTRPYRVQPYTVTDLRTGLSVPLPREHRERSLVICSAGLDSTTVAYSERERGREVGLLHFTYGCKAETREVDRVKRIAEHLKAPLAVVPLDYSQFVGSSPLLNGSEISGGVEGAEFAHEWVPARNLVMLALATAFAEANGYTYIALGNNLEESGAYPDNEEEFTYLMNQALDYAVHDGGQVRIESPVGNLMKHEIVKLGTELGVPYELTWSCYRDGEYHCGRCGPCYMRREAFKRNGLNDPTTYEVG